MLSSYYKIVLYIYSGRLHKIYLNPLLDSYLQRSAVFFIRLALSVQISNQHYAQTSFNSHIERRGRPAA
jgi:hypothetical protein